MSTDQTNSTPPLDAPPLARPSQRSQPIKKTAQPNATQPDAPHAGPDPNLVHQTRNQIRSLATEIDELAKSGCGEDDFFEGFLTRLTSALASVGGAIWMLDDQQQLSLRYQINLKNSGLNHDPADQAVHQRLLLQLIEKNKPSLIAPQSGSADSNSPGNPTDNLLVVAPLVIDRQPVGLLQIFQRPGTGPNTQQGYLRFVSQMAETGSRYLADSRIRSFESQQAMWHQLEQFIQTIHQGLDTKETVYTLANESRRLIDCDRVSVALGTGRNCRVQAVSGLDSIERRAEQVKLLNLLSAAVIKGGQPLWYHDQHQPLPPQIESKLQRYIDQSHTKMLAIVPLLDKAPDADIDRPNQRKTKDRPIGAIIIEQLSDSRIADTTRRRVSVVVDHGQTALANADRYSSIFLMPLWQFLGRITAAFNIENRWKTATITMAIVVSGMFLTMFPYTFGLGANGRLVPQSQFEVFAQTDGTMDQVYVSDTGDTVVAANQVLGRMKNSDIELAISSINGQIAEAESRIAANSQRKSSGSLELNEKTELDSLIKSDEQKIDSLNRELHFREEEKKLLTVVSPSAGRVINWNVKQNLTHRPVTRGQNLMTIVPPEAVWELELQMPERRLAHLFRTINTGEENPNVTFGLVSNPGVEYTGRLISVDRKLDVYSDDGNAALVRVAFDNSEIPAELLRNETRVTAKVECGTRSIGYVIFHELIETVQSKWMLWF